jgi:hypothetical protein
MHKTMLEQEIKNIWKNSGREDKIKLDKTILLLELDKKLSSFERKIKHRDRREIYAGLFLIAAAILGIFLTSDPVTKIILFLVIPYVLFVIRKLLSVKKHQVKDMSLSVIDFMRNYKFYLQKEMALLRTVFWWYILPLLILYSAFIFNVSTTTLYLLTHIIVGIAASALIVYLNLSAVKNYFKPLILNVDKAIEELEKEDIS